ncbi:MAG: acyl-CoA carboxylase subunit beta [Acidimicrobiia bacterium]
MSDSYAAPVNGRQSDAARAELRALGDHQVAWFAIEGGKHHGAIGEAGGEVITRAIRMAIELGIPVVGELDTSGADIGEGPTGLHAWGTMAKALADASGVVPTILIVDGACISGPALILGMADVVIMTNAAFAYVSGPESVREFTGVEISRTDLGSPTVHDTRTGVASLLAPDTDTAYELAEHLLDYLPTNHLQDPPVFASDDPADRACSVAAAAVPQRATASYDVRTVVRDVLDVDSFLELRAGYAPNLVIGLGRLDGRTVGIVANQPQQRAGTLDIEASRKAARFVQWCDAFNIPIVTFVDTPGFEPGRDLEWRGMIRHGAELVFAYGDATVPRICIVLRKAYGGAYIVMDSRGLGNDWCCAWPNAEIAVMGAQGAVQILYGKKLATIEDDAARAAEHAALLEEYEGRFSNPYQAAERGYVDAVIGPDETRTQVIAALQRLATKRDHQPRRRHGNGPL